MTASRRRRRADAGFTLLEVLVALVILGVAVVAAIQGFAQGLRLLKLAGDHQEAVMLADQKAREVITPTEGRDEGTEGVFRWERTVSPVPAPDLQPASGAVPAWRVYQIAVRVQWDTSRRVDVATLRTVAVPRTVVTTTAPTTPPPALGPTPIVPVTPAPSGLPR
jgi:general secretion pathway protein I